MKRTIRLFLFFCLVSLIFETASMAKEQILIPDDVVEICEKYGQEYEICPELLEAMCWHETRCRGNLTNGGCVGITQINPKYHKAEMELLGITDLTDNEQNIHLCAYIIKQFANEDEDLYYVLMKWNCGTTRAKKLWEQGKTTKYAKEVSEESATLERMHGK